MCDEHYVKHLLVARNNTFYTFINQYRVLEIIYTVDPFTRIIKYGKGNAEFEQLFGSLVRDCVYPAMHLMGRIGLPSAATEC